MKVCGVVGSNNSRKGLVQFCRVLVSRTPTHIAVSEVPSQSLEQLAAILQDLQHSTALADDANDLHHAIIPDIIP
ncbi:hypothetical protein J6590_051810 [Homalodisca vitripennis]|nr:hypothetical protein J6590_051810 [Homalodisca vitripennis]